MQVNIGTFVCSLTAKGGLVQNGQDHRMQEEGIALKIHIGYLESYWTDLKVGNYFWQSVGMKA